jgi:hypothetical protein
LVLKAGVEAAAAKPGVVEKHPAGLCQFDAVHAARNQCGADLVLEGADLPAERRLRGVQPVLRRERQASLFGDSDEVAQVTQFHGGDPCSSGMASSLQSLLRPSQKIVSIGQMNGPVSGRPAPWRLRPVMRRATLHQGL